MKKKDESKAFALGFVCKAQVKAIKENCVVFSLSSTELDGIYYLPRHCHLNLYTLFKVGEFWSVKVMKIIKRLRKKEFGSYTEMFIDVVPQNFPMDDYVQVHPLGTIVKGKVKHQYHSGDCVIVLAPNVECILNGCHSLKKGQEVFCKIEHYNSLSKKILISLC